MEESFENRKSRWVNHMEKILRVEKGRAGDGSKGYVRIDSRDRMSIGVEPGDMVEIRKGNRSVTAIVRKIGRDYAGRGVIRLPEVYRERLGVKIGENVVVDRAYRKESYRERGEVSARSSRPYYPEEYAQRTVPPTQQKNPGIAAVLSFLFVGLGQIYNGQIGKGLAFFVLGIVLAMSMFIIIGLILYPIFWIYTIYDAYNTAKKINTGEIRV